MTQRGGAPDSGPRHVLLTGGAGFIGHHVLQALLKRGCDVTVVDDLSTGRRSHVPEGVRLVVADIADQAAIGQALENVDAVCHLAARVSIRNSVEHVVEDARCNVLGALQVMEAAAQFPTVSRFVLASSMAVYADSPAGQPVAEQDPTVPRSPYGVSKLAAERYLALLAERCGWNWSALRLFNTYGTGQRLSPYVGVITIFIDKLLRGDPLPVYGDGAQVRDFVHVSDVATAFCLALEASAESSGIYNIGSGTGTTVLEIATRLQQALDLDVPIEHLPPRTEELRYSVAQLGAARAALGFKPRAAADALERLALSARAAVGGD